MKGRASEQGRRALVKKQDYLSIEDWIHDGSKNRGEIAVFDAGKYFEAGVHNCRTSRVGERGEMEDQELHGEADTEAAGGDLPLSPLPEFYNTTGKTKYSPRKDQRHQNHEAHVNAKGDAQDMLARKSTRGAASTPSPGKRRMGTTSIDLCRRPTEENLSSPPAVASSTGRSRHCNAAPLRDCEYDKVPSKSSNNKPQPFSPSARLASFLAKFKLSSSESKSKPPQQGDKSMPSPPTSAPAVTPPKSFFSTAAALPPNGKAPSPRSRFLRALSSSSSHSNTSVGTLKALTKMHHHSSIAVSTPVSPAGSDPYSPITQSASTTPTSRKNPRSRPRSHTSTYHEGASPGSKSSLPTTDWRRDIDNSSASRSLSTHLPFLRRKLRAYLMPEKSPKSNHFDNHQPVTNRHDRMMNHAPQHAVTSNCADEMQHRSSHKAISAEPAMDNRRPANHSSTATRPARQHDHQQVFLHHNPNHIGGNTTRSSPTGRRTTLDMSKTAEAGATTKDASRRRGDWRRHIAEEVEDDIEVAERLLRVVKEHQSTHQTYSSSNYKGKTSNYRHNSMQQVNGQLVVENGSPGRKNRKSTISPYSSPARLVVYNSKHASKEEFACPYDSDSSSDMFEIETLQAFSHVAGLYRPRDLPVYDTPRHIE